MANLYKTEGVIMARRDLGEADQMITAFTKDFGKIALVAKGTRLLHSKLRGHLNVMARSRLVFVSGRDIFRLTDAEETINYCSAIKNGRRAVAGRALNLLDRLLQGSEKDEALWRLVVDFLENGASSGDALDGNDKNLIETLFGARALRVLGYVHSDNNDLNELLDGSDWSPEKFAPFKAELDGILRQGLNVSHL